MTLRRRNRVPRVVRARVRALIEQSQYCYEHRHAALMQYDAEAARDWQDAGDVFDHDARALAGEWRA